MEFKDRLRKLREEKGLTQKQLADAVYVSRSAVAKWENGLGLPGDAAYESLCVYFGVTEEEFPLTEEAAAVVRKNEIIAVLMLALTTVGIVLLGFGTLILLSRWDPARPLGEFGFTKEMAVGYSTSDTQDLWIETPDFAFKYHCWEREDPEDDMIAFILPVRKLPIGWKYVDYTGKPGYIFDLVDEADNFYGCVYAFPGKDTYHYFIFYEPLRLPAGETDWPREVTVDGETVPLYKYRYFTTDKPLTELEANGHHLFVSDTHFD